MQILHKRLSSFFWHKYNGKIVLNRYTKDTHFRRSWCATKKKFDLKNGRTVTSKMSNFDIARYRQELFYEPFYERDLVLKWDPVQIQCSLKGRNFKSLCFSFRAKQLTILNLSVAPQTLHSAVKINFIHTHTRLTPRQDLMGGMARNSTKIILDWHIRYYKIHDAVNIVTKPSKLDTTCQSLHSSGMTWK